MVIPRLAPRVGAEKRQLRTLVWNRGLKVQGLGFRVEGGF